MTKRKKYIISGLLDSTYEIYAKQGTRKLEHKKNKRNTQVRVVPGGFNWSVPTGIEGDTFIRLEDDGNGVTFFIDNDKESFYLNYFELYSLQLLLKAYNKIEGMEGIEERELWIESDFVT